MTANPPDWRQSTLEHAVDIGPAPTPPDWCAPDALPAWERLSEGGSACFWTRDFDGVWIACEDYIIGGRILRTPARIHHFESSRDGITASGARMLAAQLLNAADRLDQTAH